MLHFAPEVKKYLNVEDEADSGSLQLAQREDTPRYNLGMVAKVRVPAISHTSSAVFPVLIENRLEIRILVLGD